MTSLQTYRERPIQHSRDSIRDNVTNNRFRPSSHPEDNRVASPDADGRFRFRFESRSTAGRHSETDSVGGRSRSSQNRRGGNGDGGRQDNQSRATADHKTGHFEAAVASASRRIGRADGEDDDHSRTDGGAGAVHAGAAQNTGKKTLKTTSR